MTLPALQHVWNGGFTFLGTNSLDLSNGPVLLGADATVNVHDISISKYTNYLADCIGLANICKELDAKASTFRCSFNNSCDIYE